jgi:hypothetical protein
MRLWIGAIVILFAAASAQADMLYLQNGQVYSGKVTPVDSTALQIELADGTFLNFPRGEIFQVTDDTGKILFEGTSAPVLVPQISPGIISPPLESPTTEKPAPPQLEYRKVMHFPYWPLLGGTILFGYFGVDQLHKSSDSYDESVKLEQQGLAFDTVRNRSQKQKTWGQISIAAAVACLIVGATPRFEKVPIQQSIRLVPSGNGLTLTFNF